MWGEMTRVENRGETTRGETTRGETSCYHPDLPYQKSSTLFSNNNKLRRVGASCLLNGACCLLNMGRVGYHDLPERTETDRNGPKRSGTDQNGPKRTGTDRNGLSWIPKRTFWVPKRTLMDTETDRNGPERTETDRNGPKRTFVVTETDFLGTETDFSGYRN